MLAIRSHNFCWGSELSPSEARGLTGRRSSFESCPARYPPKAQGSPAVVSGSLLECERASRAVLGGHREHGHEDVVGQVVGDAAGER
jgi:hypothetical protein